jgi:hypothetical protein
MKGGRKDDKSKGNSEIRLRSCILYFIIPNTILIGPAAFTAFSGFVGAVHTLKVSVHLYVIRRYIIKPRRWPLGGIYVTITLKD